MQVLLFVLALGVTSAVLDLDAEWSFFKKTHNKVYKDAETERFRRGVWEYHLNVIKQHNVEADKGLHTFRMGVNAFADMPNSEFRRLMTGLVARNDTVPRRNVYRKPGNVHALPAEVDWRTKGYVTSVENQGNCGSCWAFSANGALEGQWFKKTGDLIPLSEQNLMDCSVSEGNIGCLGGRMDFAYEYVRKNDGEDTEESYPYEEMDGLPCRFARANVGASVTGFTYIDVGDEEAQQAAVAEIGPLAVAMDALQLSFQLYRSGVYYDRGCSSVQLNHAVTAIGYGSTPEGDDYWLIKNSWGTGWGEEGFARMARNRNNNCGIATDSLYPNV